MSEKKTIKTVVLSPRDGIAFKSVVDTLDTWYKELGCELIEIHNVDIGGRRFEVICDEEARLKNERLWISGIPLGFPKAPCIVGTIAITGAADDEGDLTTLTEDDYELILRNVSTSLGIVENNKRVPIVSVKFAW